jgi:hypothetical protein
MKIDLEQPVWIGNVAVAAIVETQFVCHEIRRSLSARSRKRPMAVLVHRAGVTRVYDVEGNEISPNDIDNRFPGQLSAFEHQMQP